MAPTEHLLTDWEVADPPAPPARDPSQRRLPAGLVALVMVLVGLTLWAIGDDRDDAAPTAEREIGQPVPSVPVAETTSVPVQRPLLSPVAIEGVFEWSVHQLDGIITHPAPFTDGYVALRDGDVVGSVDGVDWTDRSQPPGEFGVTWALAVDDTDMVVELYPAFTIQTESWTPDIFAYGPGPSGGWRPLSVERPESTGSERSAGFFAGAEALVLQSTTHTWERVEDAFVLASDQEPIATDVGTGMDTEPYWRDITLPDDTVAIEEHDGRFTAFSRSGQVRAVLTSTDGQSWTSIDPLPAPFPPATCGLGPNDITPQVLEAGDLGWFAAGLMCGHSVVWHSFDGLTWTILDGFDDLPAWNRTPTFAPVFLIEEQRVLVYGHRRSDNNELGIEPAVWIGTPPAEERPPWVDARRGEEFDFERHDLCEWIGLDEIDEIVSQAYANAGGELPARSVQPRVERQSPSDGYGAACAWYLANDTIVWLEDMTYLLAEGDEAAELLEEMQFLPSDPDSALGPSARRTPPAFGSIAIYLETGDHLVGFAHHGPSSALGSGELHIELDIAAALFRRLGWLREIDPPRWNPILSETTALAERAQPRCADGTDPNTAGPVGQVLPRQETMIEFVGAFDPRHGAIVYVEPEGTTWYFDVCSNTWTEVARDESLLALGDEGIVYDVDSEMLVVLTDLAVATHDPDTRAWSREAITGPSPPIRGAVYDPISGLILTTSNIGTWDDHVDPERYELWAFDVDESRWTRVGWIPQMVYDFGQGPSELEFLGYVEASDQLLFAADVATDRASIRVDPRTGAMTVDFVGHPTQRTSLTRKHGPGDDTVYVTHIDPAGTICGFDPNTEGWTRCFAPPPIDGFEAGEVVGDPLNDRLVVLNTNADGNVWAVGFESGQWIELAG